MLKEHIDVRIAHMHSSQNNMDDRMMENQLETD